MVVEKVEFFAGMNGAPQADLAHLFVDESAHVVDEDLVRQSHLLDWINEINNKGNHQWFICKYNASYSRDSFLLGSVLYIERVSGT